MFARLQDAARVGIWVVAAAALAGIVHKSSVGGIGRLDDAPGMTPQRLADLAGGDPLPLGDLVTQNPEGVPHGLLPGEPNRRLVGVLRAVAVVVH